MFHLVHMYNYDLIWSMQMISSQYSSTRHSVRVQPQPISCTLCHNPTASRSVKMMTFPFIVCNMQVIKHFPCASNVIKFHCVLDISINIASFIKNLKTFLAYNGSLKEKKGIEIATFSAGVVMLSPSEAVSD